MIALFTMRILRTLHYIKHGAVEEDNSPSTAIFLQQYTLLSMLRRKQKGSRKTTIVSCGEKACRGTHMMKGSKNSKNHLNPIF